MEITFNYFSKPSSLVKTKPYPAAKFRNINAAVYSNERTKIIIDVCLQSTRKKNK